MPIKTKERNGTWIADPLPDAGQWYGRLWIISEIDCYYFDTSSIDIIKITFSSGNKFNINYFTF